MKVSVHTVGAFAENCYLLVDEPTDSAVLIDPGASGELLVEAVRATGATLRAIWLTHAHVDHVGGIRAVKRAWDVPVHLHPLDAPLYERAASSAAMYGLDDFEVPPPFDVELSDGTELRLGALRFEALHTPGHAPGHSVIVGHGIMFAGDLLFAGSIGRTDLPFASPTDMTRSLDRVAKLDPSLIVRPGHGPGTSLEHELRTNPFLNGAARVRGG